MSEKGRLDNKSKKSLQLWFWVEDLPERVESTTKVPASKSRTSKRQKHMIDLMVVHWLSAERFKDDSRDHAKTVIPTLAKDELLSPLDDAAGKVAAFYLIPAHMRHRFRVSGKYWILDGISPECPYPLGVDTAHIPRWKRPARTLERILEELDKLRCEVGRIQDHLVSANGKAMPEYLITDALGGLWQAAEWMRAFPNPSELLSKYRESLRADAESESPECVSYVLDQLFRKRAKYRLKVKECECRIAEIERKYLGQNVDYHADFGCPAVRAHVRKVKGGENRKAIDDKLKEDLEFADFREMRCQELRTLGTVEFEKRWNAQFSMLDELDKYMTAYREWSERTQAALKSRLSAQLVEGMSWDEVRKVTDDYYSAMKDHFTACERYLSEHDHHLGAMRHLDGEFWENVQSAREWMADWKKAWKLEPSTGLVRNDRESGQPPCIPTEN